MRPERTLRLIQQTRQQLSHLLQVEPLTPFQTEIRAFLETLPPPSAREEDWRRIPVWRWLSALPATTTTTARHAHTNGSPLSTIHPVLPLPTIVITPQGTQWRETSRQAQHTSAVSIRTLPPDYNALQNRNALLFPERDWLIALNTLHLEHVVQMEIPDRANVQLALIWHADRPQRAIPLTAYRLQLTVGENARVTILEHIVGNHPTHLVIEARLAKNAHVSWWHVSQAAATTPPLLMHHLAVDIREHATWNEYLLNTRGNHTLFRRMIWLSEPHSQSLFSARCLSDSPEAHLALVTHFLHMAPATTSNQEVRGLVGWRQTGTFQGRIFVHPRAQDTSAYQSTRWVPLSEHATVHELPQLEILADQVRCTHGAVTGFPTQPFLYYMRTRGIAEPLAYLLLFKGFLMEAFPADLPDPFSTLPNTFQKQALPILEKLLKQSTFYAKA